MNLERTKPLTSNALVRSFERHLRAENKRAATIDHYVGAAKQFIEFARVERLPRLEDVTREHVEMWMERLHETYAPHSVRNRFVGLRIFFRWLALEGEIERDPTLRIKPPQTDQVAKDIASPDALDTNTWSDSPSNHPREQRVYLVDEPVKPAGRMPGVHRSALGFSRPRARRCYAGAILTDNPMTLTSALGCQYEEPMNVRTHAELANFIWSICNLLRGPYKRNE